MILGALMFQRQTKWVVAAACVLVQLPTKVMAQRLTLADTLPDMWSGFFVGLSGGATATTSTTTSTFENGPVVSRPMKSEVYSAGPIARVPTPKVGLLTVQTRTTTSETSETSGAVFAGYRTSIGPWRFTASAVFAETDRGIESRSAIGTMGYILRTGPWHYGLEADVSAQPHTDRTQQAARAVLGYAVGPWAFRVHAGGQHFRLSAQSFDPFEGYIAEKADVIALTYGAGMSYALTPNLSLGAHVAARQFDVEFQRIPSTDIRQYTARAGLVYSFK